MSHARTSAAFRRFADFNIAYTILVILWGAYVRISFSGDGCGSHWPLCNGDVVPVLESVATRVELTHRISSALCGLLGIVAVVWARRIVPAGHPARRAAWAFLALVIQEGLVGKVLVELGWTSRDQRVERGYGVAVHLVSTFMLLFSCALLSLGARGKGLGGAGAGGLRRASGWALVGMLVVGAMGALTALGDTLFPPESLADGIRRELSTTAHLFERLRIVHPIAALGLSALVGFVATRLYGDRDGGARRLGVALGGLLALQLGAGLMNVLLLAPMWLQITHLLLADTLWLLLVVVYVGLPEPASEGEAPTGQDASIAASS